MRRVRRYRNTPCRANRQNRARGGIPPSTKARWGWKVRLANWLARYYPVEKMGIKRGSWVRHPKWGIVYVGGTYKGRISLHAMQTGKRLTQRVKVEDCQVLTTATWRIRTAERNVGAFN
jgi:hypothetical protein